MLSHIPLVMLMRLHLCILVQLNPGLMYLHRPLYETKPIIKTMEPIFDPIEHLTSSQNYPHGVLGEAEFPRSIPIDWDHPQSVGPVLWHLHNGVLRRGGIMLHVDQSDHSKQQVQEATAQNIHDVTLWVQEFQALDQVKSMSHALRQIARKIRGIYALLATRLLRPSLPFLQSASTYLLGRASPVTAGDSLELIGDYVNALHDLREHSEEHARSAQALV